MTDRTLIELALEAQKRSYSPYSHFSVGAALLTAGGKVYTGCNIESASYTPTICAERTAFAKAVSEGERAFAAIAIVGGNAAERAPGQYCAPCGVCRQVMAEFCHPQNFRILLANSPEEYGSYSLEQLLPLGFYPSDLQAAQ